MNTVVRHLKVDYHGQASMFDELRVRTWVRRDGRTSRTWTQELLREDLAVIARAEVVSVLVGAETWRPVPLPAIYREAFAAHVEGA